MMARLKDQHFKHQHVIKRWPATPRSIRAHNGALEISTKPVTIDHRTQPFQAVALGRELLQPFLNIKKSCLPPHLRPPASTRAIESRTRQNYEVFGSLQLLL